jgi:hypothetical protein
MLRESLTVKENGGSSLKNSAIFNKEILLKENGGNSRDVTTLKETSYLRESIVKHESKIPMSTNYPIFKKSGTIMDPTKFKLDRGFPKDALLTNIHNKLNLLSSQIRSQIGNSNRNINIK